MQRRQTPNFFRLYLNPFVAQTCLCLNRYVQGTWFGQGLEKPEYQTFLGNAFDEALSGAIKLARYWLNLQRRPLAGLIIDCEGRLGPFAGITLENQRRIDFVPDLVVLGSSDNNPDVAFPANRDYGFVVLLSSPALQTPMILGGLRTLFANHSPLIIQCIDRARLAACRREDCSFWEQLPPDIVVFDESFVHREVPFGAFAARKRLYDVWNSKALATFHSTTFQPNTIAALHFMKCLEADDPAFVAELARELADILLDKKYCRKLFNRLYSPALARTITAVGLDQADVKAAGHYLLVNGRPVFDGIAGIASSIRGHNPETYAAEIRDLNAIDDVYQAVSSRLHELTGLECLLPAVSGATAVESALRLGLLSQYPRNYVLALQGGFGGKTLFALTGTANQSYKTNLNPLYPHVVYINPFSPNAIEDLEAAFQKYPIGVVQVELIQAVGGVRAVPDQVIQFLRASRERHDCLLFIDEVQTGMFRTGHFTRCKELQLIPDILTLGKGVSDMVFPSSVTLCSAQVKARVDAAAPDFFPTICQRYHYEFGLKTLLNTLTRAEENSYVEMVSRASALFAERLSASLGSCKVVRDIRVFGLLIAIELNLDGWTRRWLGKQAPFLYLLNMLADQSFPLFLGFCQYEPNVLKLTPPLSITAEEVGRVCDTIVAALQRPLYKLLPALGPVLLNAVMKGRRQVRSNGRQKNEHAARQLSGAV
jgi:acetylornithine/succinyldiaminopimelate/putrescine aminotransferase